jgi:hypothetical protein
LVQGRLAARQGQPAVWQNVRFDDLHLQHLFAAVKVEVVVVVMDPVAALTVNGGLVRGVGAQLWM